MSFVASAVALASAVGGAVIGNQQRQKAKGQAAAAERDAAAQQAAADAKAKAEHDANIQAQSQSALVARNAASQPLARTPNVLTNTFGAQSAAGSSANINVAPIGTPRKTLLGS